MKYRSMIVISVLFVLTGVSSLTPHSFAGTFISSGGELFKDGHNPWFLSKNTEKIKYCVMVAGDEFSGKDLALNSVIEKSFGYWIAELTRVQKLFPESPVYVKMGDHKLEEVKCGKGEDVAFKFGAGTLTKKERFFFGGKLTTFVASSVRTDYDEVNLKGKGFVYVSSDKGSQKFIGDKQIKIQNPWSYEGLLFHVLVHEIGHIFGIPHVNKGVFSFKGLGSEGFAYHMSIMSEAFPEYMLKSPDYFKQIRTLSRFFGIQEEYTNCELTPAGKRFFALTPEQKCLKFQFNNGDKLNTRQVFALPSKESTVQVEIGQFTFSENGKEDVAGEINSLILVHLTEKQKLVKTDKAWPLPFIMGPALFTGSFSGKFKRAGSNEETPIQIQLEQERAKITGLEGGLIRALGL